MSVTGSQTPGVRSVTIIRTDPLPAAGAAAEQAARGARFLAAVGLLVVRNDNLPDLLFTDVSTAQNHVFEFQATMNPVQSGATITDHVRQLPVTLSIDGLLVDTPLGFPPTPIQLSRASKNFTKLLEFARQRQPVLVATSLQIYESMLITRVTVSRDVDSGSSIPVQIDFREIQIAQQLVGLPAVAESAGAAGAIPPTNSGQSTPTGTL